MTRLLQRFAVGRALHAASGTGRFAGVLAALGRDVIAVDPSRAMIEQARSRDTPVLTGDLCALPIRDESIDLVVCALALTHFEDLRAPIAELARVTRAGGHVVLSDIPSQWLSAATRCSGMRRTASWWCAITSTGTRTTSRAFREAGLRIRDCVEPRVSEQMIAVLGEPVRDAFRDACWAFPTP